MENLKLYQVRRMQDGAYLEGEPDLFRDFERLAENLVKACSMYNLKINKVDAEITTINKAVFLDLLNNGAIFWLEKKEVQENEANSYYEVRRFRNLDNPISYL